MSAVIVDPGLQQRLYSSIENKRLIRFRYNNKERVVEPHDYGVQNGIARLLSWQVGGQSSNRLPGWRWFDVAEMRDLEVLNRSFPGNKEGSEKPHRWDEIFIRVAPPNMQKEARRKVRS